MAVLPTRRTVTLNGPPCPYCKEPMEAEVLLFTRTVPRRLPSRGGATHRTKTSPVAWRIRHECADMPAGEGREAILKRALAHSREQRDQIREERNALLQAMEDLSRHPDWGWDGPGSAALHHMHHHLRAALGQCERVCCGEREDGADDGPRAGTVLQLQERCAAYRDEVNRLRQERDDLVEELTTREAQAAAKALREAADEMDDTDDPDALYVDNGDIDLWLRVRADRIARGESYR